MSQEIDFKDKKLISLLMMNSRAHLHELARPVNLSKNSVKYRIARLQERGYIKKFIPFIDYGKIDYCTFDLFLKLKSTEEEEKNLVEHLKNHPHNLWFMKLFGEWDYFIQFVTSSFYEFYDHHLSKFMEHYGSFIDEYEVKVSVKRLKLEPHVPGFPPIEKDEIKSKQKKREQNSVVVLDPVDRLLLQELARDASSSFLEIGMAIKESLETTRNHFYKLMEKGVLGGFSIDVGIHKLGYIDYLVFFKFHNFPQIIETQFRQFIKSKKEITLALKNGNVPEIYLIITSRHPIEIDILVKEIKNRFINSIQKITTLTVIEYITNNPFPSGLLSDLKKHY